MMRFAKFGGLVALLAAGCGAPSPRQPPVNNSPDLLGTNTVVDLGGNGQDLGNGGQDLGNRAADLSTSGNGGQDLGGAAQDIGPATADLGPPPTTGNSTPIIADGYPGGSDGVPDVGFISVTICAPNSTTNCATIDHISIDTGSVGLHILASEIPSTLLSALPLQTSGSSSVTECYIYEDGYVYGSVRTADLKIAGEKAAGMPFMAIGDTSFSKAPRSCSKSGKNDGSSAASFGGKGIIGIAPYTPDCGADCASGKATNPIYFGCPASGTCTAIAEPLTSQLPNPVAAFASDNNGVVIDMPAISDSGAFNPTGTLYFGVNTQADNMISTQTVLGGTDQGGIITVDDTVGSNTEAVAIFDSGTSIIAVTDSNLSQCSDNQGIYCPTSTTTENASFTGTASSSASTTFKFGNGDTLYNSFPTTYTAFDDLGGPGEAADQGSPGMDIYGFPFFFGHKLFFINEGATAGSITGPAYAF